MEIKFEKTFSLSDNQPRATVTCTLPRDFYDNTGYVLGEKLTAAWGTWVSGDIRKKSKSFYAPTWEEVDNLATLEIDKSRGSVKQAALSLENLKKTQPKDTILILSI